MMKLTQSKKTVIGWKTPIVRYAILVVLAHIVMNVIHGTAHQQLGVSISDFQSAYVFLVTLVAPIVAVIMLLFLNKTKILLGGAWLLLVSMLASLLFGIVYHIVIPSPDNIFTVMQNPSLYSIVFTSTAILLLIIEGIGTWVGVRASRTMAKVLPR
jgi:amino acid permease